MPPASPPRLARVAALLALAASGCTVEATGALITVRTGACVTPDLHVTISQAGRVLAEQSYARVIDDGATFGVRLPDGLEGQTVTVSAGSTAFGACSDHVDLVVARNQVVRRELSLALCCPDAPDLSVPRDGMDDGPGADLGPPDLTHSDLGDLSVAEAGPLPDLSAADLTVVDLVVPPDLVCVPRCAGSIQTVCENGVARDVQCAFGCSGDHCLGPSSCNAPGDVSAPGTYQASTAGTVSTTRSSCENKDEIENAFSFSPGLQWGTFTLTLDAAFPAALSSRLVCGDPMSEVLADGPCTGKLTASACQSGAGKATQVLCGLPPNRTYYAFLQDVNGVGGLYGLRTAFSPVDLNDCQNAGMLPGAKFNLSGDTRGQANKNQAPAQVMNCADRGAAAREMVFWVPVPTLNVQPNLTVTVTGKNGFLPLVYVEQYCQDLGAFCGKINGNVASVSFDQIPAGAWVIFVDGQNGSEGEFDLAMTLQ